MALKKTTTYLQAQAWAITNLILTQRDWQNRRDPIYPYCPRKSYKAVWKGWPAFLKRPPLSIRKAFFDYHTAQIEAAKLGITNGAQYIKLRTKKFPSNPQLNYKANWKGWKEFLGTSMMSFKDARTYVRNLRIDGVLAFQAWAKSSARPKNFPSNPQNAYPSKFKGYTDFLGIAPLVYDDAKDLATNSAIRLRKDWTKAGLKAAGIKKTRQIRLTVQKAYKGKYEGSAVFFGRKPVIPFDDLKQMIAPMQFKRSEDYKAWVMAYRINNPQASKKIPLCPDKNNKYGYAEWIDWFDFLGK